MIKSVVMLVFFLGVLGCAHKKPTQDDPQLSPITLSTSLPSSLPVAVSNNAVAYLNVDGHDKFYSFNGLLSGKTYLDITNKAFVWQQGHWSELKVPREQLPVLASTAITVGTAVYLIGGYTVAADHSEKSVPHVWRIDGETHQWTAMPAMPTPVDDTVALAYSDRYIYLISGWHDVDNVNLVQVFDTQEQTWHQASQFPLPPVFGHAGGIVANKMVVCDGVKVVKKEGKKQFLPSPVCAVGEINQDNITEINWRKIEHHSGTAYYRMAASDYQSLYIYFIGGSDNPYNYDGVGYNTVPSNPSSDIRIYNLLTEEWITKADKVPPTMDHRAALKTPYGLVVLGGMAEQQVTDRIIYYKE